MAVYMEEEYLQLSGIQHFAFCRRQWALIHVEQQWAENYQTTAGLLMHKKAHDEISWSFEKRGTASLCLIMMEPGLLCRWNTSAEQKKRESKTPCSSARRPCVWKNNFSRRFQRDICFTGKRSAGRRLHLMKRCADRWWNCARKCMDFTGKGIRRR